MRLLLFSNRFGNSTLAIRYAPRPAITCSLCVVLLGTYVLRGNLSLLGMVQHVVDYSYSHPDCRRRFTAVSTARAMPARVAEGSLPGRALFGTLVSHLPSFFYDLRRNRFEVRKYGVERDGGKNQGNESGCACKTLSDKSCRDSPANSTIVNLQSKLGRT